ncbi:MAG: F0F1 ATP synthase subunit gamma [Candidatus Sungbacteria bacterium]|nr:F0F1 ATP synthase subunit gamma [Candidatus Sungbacteria bacterium]
MGSIKESGMTSTKSIKQRIKSVKNTSQITKAMEVVSATKMRKSQGFAVSARPYAAASLELMKNLLIRTPSLPPLLQARPVRTSALLVVTSDKGLAGAFNTLITVGKKSRDFLERRGHPIQDSFWGFGDYSTLEQTLPVAETLLDGYLLGAFDEVEAVYTNFRTTLLQEAMLKRILPVTKEGIEEMVKGILPERGRYSIFGGDTSEKTDEYSSSLSRRYNYEYKFEPSPAEILSELVPQLLRMHVHHLILESNASEHSARMVAMKSASDNARELITDLTLEFNKARQANITRELTEITAGAEVLAQ